MDLKNPPPIVPAIFLILFIVAEACLKNYIGNDSLQTFAVILLLCSGAYLFYYFLKRQNIWDDLMTPSEVNRNTVIIFAIIAAGFVFRFWRLGSLFDGMAWDEAYKGLDAIAIRIFGDRPVFLDWNAGREALIAYLVAFTQNFLDYSIVSVRSVLATAGVLTLIFFYLFTKRIFNHRVAILATFLMCVSKWHIIHTRYAVRVGLIVLFEVAVLYFLASGTQSKRKNAIAFIVAGVIGGLGLYTYIAYRIFPLVALAFLLEKPVRTEIRNHVKSIAAGLLAAVLIVAPLAKFSLDHRESFTDRLERTAVWKTRGATLSTAGLVFDATLKTLGLYTYEGDSIARHNVNKEPMLSPFASSFFILGFLLVLRNVKKPFGRFLLLYFFLTALPGMLSVNAPHASRTLGSVAPAMLFTTFGIFAAAKILLDVSKLLTTLFAAIVLGGNFYTGPNDGLLRYAQILDSLDHKTSSLWGMDRDEYRVTQLLNQLGPSAEVYVSPQLFFHSAVEYLTYSKSEHKLYTFGTNLQRTWKQGKQAIIVVQPHETNMWWLRDDEGKRFFKWWRQAKGYSPEHIRSITTKAYIHYGRMMRMSDFRLIQHIQETYPHASPVKLGSFDVYVIGRKK